MRRSLATSFPSSNFAVVFDIDGVLIKGSKVVQGAASVLKSLQHNK
jgi:ribonucleotide monophosphatase NagD (HAD superfamily)